MSNRGGSFSSELLVPLTQTAARTRIKIWKCCYRWVIENFCFCPRTTGQALESPNFTVGPNSEQKWKLELYPQGIVDEYQEYVSIYLKLAYSTESRTHAKFEISLINDIGKKIIVKSDDGVFGPYSSKGWKDFIKRDVLFKRSMALTSVAPLTVHCELTASVETRNFPALEDIRLTVPRFVLPEKMMGLLHNGMFSDVVITTGREEFRVHAAILAANSPKFYAMLRDKTPSETVYIEINGHDVETVSDLLAFMYAGRIPNFSDVRAEKMLDASNEYSLDELKKMVEDVLMNRVKIDTAAQILLLSDKHCARRLKEYCLDFIQKNVAAVLDTDAWKSAIKERPRLVDEVATKLAICLSGP